MAVVSGKRSRISGNPLGTSSAERVEPAIRDDKAVRLTGQGKDNASRFSFKNGAACWRGKCLCSNTFLCLTRRALDDKGLRTASQL